MKEIGEWLIMIGYILIASAFAIAIGASIWLKFAIYDECKAAEHTNLYCIHMIGR